MLRRGCQASFLFILDEGQNFELIRPREGVLTTLTPGAIIKVLYRTSRGGESNA